MEEQRVYVCIDFKSFYASVECIERGLDPLNNNLVVADPSRTEKTICLAVTPSLKSFGISGRARLFEVVQTVNNVNKERFKANNYKQFIGESYVLSELNSNPKLKLGYIVAQPRMALYIEYSTRIYEIYLRYVSKEDIHVYSIDEVFIDITNYLKTYKMNAHDLAIKMIKDVFKETRITATCGIGTNLYLAKVAMDIVAKHVPADQDGMRIAELDEMSYRRKLWSHTPLTEFWRVGKGYYKKLTAIGVQTMGDIARLSINDESKLYQLFGINAELLIDHAWGYEPTTMKEIKKYKPDNRSLSTGQVLHCAHTNKQTFLIVKEMADQLSLDLLGKGLCTNLLILSIGYDIDNDLKNYDGEIVSDYLGRRMPKPAHSSTMLKRKTTSTKIIVESICKLYERITDPRLLIRRINIGCATFPVGEETVQYEQLDIFTDIEKKQKEEVIENERLKKENSIQHTVIDLKNKYGKNIIVKGMNLEEGATMIDRNKQIGGHKA